MSEMKWYIVNVYSNFEKKVAESIKISAAENSLSDFFGDILIPSEDIIEVKRGKKINRERKFFPGYIIVKMLMNDSSFHLIKSIPRVTGFLGSGKNPTPISQKEVDHILGSMKEGAKKTSVKLHFDIGSSVKVIDGPFASFTGVVEQIDEDSSRLKVAVSIFGRATPVELSYDQVEKM